MDKTIKVELSPQGIDEAIREIEAYQKELSAKNAEFVSALAEEAARTADAHFPGGKTYSEKGIETGSDPTHSTHVDTSSSKTRAAADMVVEGPELLFVEFGSGVHYNGAAGTSPHPLGGEFGYTIGSYGKGHGRRQIWGYADSGGDTILTHGTPAAKPVYDAYLDLKSRWRSIAHSIFG